MHQRGRHGSASANCYQLVHSVRLRRIQLPPLGPTAGSRVQMPSREGHLFRREEHFHENQKTLPNQVRKKKRKSFFAKPPRNQAKFAPTSPRVDTSVCANTAKAASFPPTPDSEKPSKQTKLQQRKTTEIWLISPPPAPKHSAPRNCQAYPAKSLINGFFSAQLPIFILPFFNKNAIQIGHRLRR